MILRHLSGSFENPKDAFFQNKQFDFWTIFIYNGGSVVLKQGKDGSYRL